MKPVHSNPGGLIPSLLAAWLVAGCGSRQGAPASEPRPRAGREASDTSPQAAAALPGATLMKPTDPARDRQIPFTGALGSPTPPPGAAPPPRPLPPTDQQALAVLYQRPAPMGPPPIARKTPRAIMVVGKGPIFSQLPGVPAYAEKYPKELLKAEGGKDLFSNEHNVELSEGAVQFVAFDRTVNDSKLSKDSMAFEASFTDQDGAKWKIIQTRLSTVSPDQVNDPWYGGVAIDTVLHGDTHRAEGGEPKTMCAMCSWGWADIWKNGAKVTSSALLHVMLSSNAHEDKNGFKYIGYDVTDQPIREVHVVVKPGSDVPSPGGYLHVMFQNADVTRGTPDEIERKAPKLQPVLPDITLNAVPYLQWGTTEIKMQAGQPVRLILNNLDPSSFHVFVVRTPDGLVTVPLPQGEQWTTTLSFDQPGEYEYWCSVANHRNRGMYGRIIVTASVPGGTEGPPGSKK